MVCEETSILIVAKASCMPLLTPDVTLAMILFSRRLLAHLANFHTMKAAELKTPIQTCRLLKSDELGMGPWRHIQNLLHCVQKNRRTFYEREKSLL